MDGQFTATEYRAMVHALNEAIRDDPREVGYTDAVVAWVDTHLVVAFKDAELSLGLTIYHPTDLFTWGSWAEIESPELMDGRDDEATANAAYAESAIGWLDLVGWPDSGPKSRIASAELEERDIAKRVAYAIWKSDQGEARRERHGPDR